MSSVLFVPIHLDALPLGNDQTFVGSMADFTLMPYFDGRRDVNPNVAYVSEDIVSRPFEDQTFYMKAGVHLHWALPDALTRGEAQDGGTKFPAVPNRWLVIRSRPDAEGRTVEEKRWVVESNYLYPDGAGDTSGSVSVPYRPAAGERRPFRFLGRNMPFAAWSQTDTSAQYFTPLTAVGYGEPSFAAFYPNCHSVFGFHDSDFVGAPPAGVRYDVLGWYSASAAGDAGDGSGEDFLDTYVADTRASYSKENAGKAPDAASLIASLEKDTGWSVLLEDVVNWYEEAQREQVRTYLASVKTDCQGSNKELPSASDFIGMVSDEQHLTVAAGSGAEFPAQVVCYASLTFEAPHGLRANPAASDPNTAVAVGNTGTEALSAYLARLIDTDHKPVIEDQLEALLLSSRLEHRQLDVGFKFEEARHEKGFTAVSGGSLWTVTQETPGEPAPASAPDAEPLQEVTLPNEVAQQLNALNSLQQQYDQSQQSILAMRRQLFSDWYKYMLSAYPPEDSKDDYPDADEVKNYIETKGVAPLSRALTATGELLLQSDAAGAVIDATSSGASGSQGSSGSSLAASLAAAVKDLLRSLDFDTNPALQDLLKYKVTEQVLDSLKSGGMPDSLAQSLANLKGEAPQGKADFLKLVSAQLGDEQATAYGPQILKASQAVLYRLKLTPGPRFWQPNEPVVLLSGAAAEPTDRHGQDGLLRDDGLLICRVLPATDLKDAVPSNFDALTGMLEQIRAAAGAESFAFNSWTENPWNPLLVEWEVEVFPVEFLNNLHPRSEGYTADFIMGNYALREEAVDLAYKAGRGAVTKAANIYTGRSIMTPHAGLKFEQELERFFIDFMEPDLLERFYTDESVAEADRNQAYLLRNFQQLSNWYLSSSNVLQQFYKEQGRTPDAATNESWLRENISVYVSWSLARVDVKKRFYDAQQTPDEDRTDAYLSAHADQFVAWLKPQIYDLSHFYTDSGVPAAQQSDAYLQAHPNQLIAWYQTEIQSDLQMVVMSEAYMRLTSSNYISQSLGGFNDALLMHRQTMQLDIADPLGFEEYQEFAARVRDAVGTATTIAPQPLNDFNPVLSGAMRLNHLRLVDTFGQVLDVNTERVTATNLMTTPESDYLLTLPPRLVQPARLNFRWLSASAGEMEMNDHPATSPVCGWVLPNNLDSSLMVYDADGLPLGSINPLVGWQTAPGQVLVKPSDIRNQHLRRMVEYLVGQDSTFLNDFITTIDSALENIEPENFAQHKDLALLVGRPLALVRATVQWELQGAPALNQSWEAFRLDLGRNVRETDRFTSVQFPVRVGEYRQLNDGLIGYWKEANDAYEGGVFYAPQSTAVGSEKIKTHADVQSDDDEPVALFLSADSPAQNVAMLVDTRGDVHATSGVVPTKAINIPPDQYATALHAIQVTFLSTPVLTAAGAINLPLPAEAGYRWAWLQKVGADWTETTAIGGVRTAADFNGQQELREGWLKLSEAEETSPSGTQ